MDDFNNDFNNNYNNNYNNDFYEWDNNNNRKSKFKSYLVAGALLTTFGLLLGGLGPLICFILWIVHLCQKDADANGWIAGLGVGVAVILLLFGGCIMLIFNI